MAADKHPITVDRMLVSLLVEPIGKTHIIIGTGITKRMFSLANYGYLN